MGTRALCIFLALLALSQCKPRPVVWIYTSLYKDTIGKIEPLLAREIPDADIRWYQGGSETISARINAEIATGRGFAVVAQEVRALAHKSQVAASEIGSVIKRMEETTVASGLAFEAILPRVENTAGLVAEIAATAEEQDSSIVQMRNAMNDVDNDSQTNSASSEQLAATAEEFNAQVQTLRTQLSHFRSG